MSSASFAAVRGLPSLARTATPFRVQASGGKKIKTDTPYGTGGGMDLRNGIDASGRKPTGKGIYQFVDKYGANVDGYRPIYDRNDWSPSDDVYVGGTAGLAIWVVTLLGILAGGTLLVYNTSALAQ
ncbi:photosystem II 10 kDa polypeptide, chloroplastic-like [Salvia splendens]|uniref:photosystem II 10 kDa polypeptide, chloroplastic-like n=1 Tax=Salvia splendens TaxID=180675 RepID=UPI001C265F27|nr:photosystem II 10 kDa polypeptide, chloroplastic-like [Salvia splendens]